MGTRGWQLEDPAGQGVEAVRPIRDEIKGLIEGLIAEIDAKKQSLGRPSLR
ncbi:hypothetical protein AB0D29_04915 [Streptomyces sp. NPDC048424]|uniref:hypothetical protein n=1 Tax=Streptomyces sp. NPDC048424 TaxID=3155265 RepID=UPI00341BC4BC